MKNKERRTVKLVVVIGIALVILGFTLFQSQNLIKGPRVSIENPMNGETLDTSVVQIKGTAKNISEIRLNGRQIFIDETGVFSEKILLSLGYNKMVVEAKDRFGRSTQESLELVLE